MFDIGFTPEAMWGILSVTRAFATGAHYCEEIERGAGTSGSDADAEEWYVGPEDRPVPPPEARKQVARAMEAQTPEGWKAAFVERQKISGSGWAIIEEIDDPRRKI